MPVRTARSCPRHSLPLAALGALVLLGAACTSGDRVPDLGAIYDAPAQQIGPARTPVVVLPGILGSKLEAPDGRKVWGAFTMEAIDPETPDGARTIAVPMRLDAPLTTLEDEVEAVDVLDYVVADVGFFRGLQLGAYVDIMSTLGAGRYRDQSLGESGAIDYGGLHYTCFQYPYDWRLDLASRATALDRLIGDAQAAVRSARGLPPDAPVKVDVVAHSMGGLVLRYYLRYGTQPLADDGALPVLDWRGARNVSRAILVGTPSAGSAQALLQLVDGWDLGFILPNYRPALLGTMPAIYQLLPRARHARVVDESGAVVDLLDPDTWIRYGWGLAHRELAASATSSSVEHHDETLAWLLPDEPDAASRRAVALDHLKKCLARARRFHETIDRPASPPPGTEIHLFAGDGEPTSDVLVVDANGALRVGEAAPGDGTVTRSSALMDERIGGAWRPGLVSPVDWRGVQFMVADHLGLTRHPAFVDNLLYLLLEAPRPGATGGSPTSRGGAPS